MTPGDVDVVTAGGDDVVETTRTEVYDMSARVEDVPQNSTYWLSTMLLTVMHAGAADSVLWSNVSVSSASSLTLTLAYQVRQPPMSTSQLSEGAVEKGIHVVRGAQLELNHFRNVSLVPRGGWMRRG